MRKTAACQSYCSWASRAIRGIIALFKGPAAHWKRLGALVAPEKRTTLYREIAVFAALSSGVELAGRAALGPSGWIHSQSGFRPTEHLLNAALAFLTRIFICWVLSAAVAFISRLLTGSSDGQRCRVFTFGCLMPLWAAAIFAIVPATFLTRLLATAAHAYSLVLVPKGALHLKLVHSEQRFFFSFACIAVGSLVLLSVAVGSYALRCLLPF